MKVSECVDAYLEHKHSCGYKCDATRKVIRRFAGFFGTLNISTIADSHLDSFLSRAPSDRSWQIYSGHLRCFFDFWFARRQVTRIPEPSFKRRAPRTFRPHVFSRVEICNLMDATTACQRANACTIGPETLRTTILFLYATGMRVPDALALSDTDVDFAHATIRVGCGSGFGGRVIPMGRDVKRLLRRYLHSHERCRFGRGRPLFLTKKGKPVKESTFFRTFCRLRRKAAVEHAEEPHQPRIIDLRHTFAVHSITHWNRKGIESDKMLPLLAAYMGNLDVLGMQRYLALAPSSFQPQLNRLKI